jgi:hypothetical protein
VLLKRVRHWSFLESVLVSYEATRAGLVFLEMTGTVVQGPLTEIPVFLVNEMSELTFEDLNLHGSTAAKV